MAKNSMPQSGGETPSGVRGDVPALIQETGRKSSGVVQVVEFILGSEHFAVDLFNVREVVEYKTITKLPNSPPYLRGIIDLRGEITTIVDLKQRLNIENEKALDENSMRIIVLDEKITASKTGILVDDVNSVSTFEIGQVDRTHGSANETETGILGIIKKKVSIKDKDVNELIIWIDIKSLLADVGTVAQDIVRPDSTVLP